MRSFISFFFITLGLITIVIGSELYIADKHFTMYEKNYELMNPVEKEKFSKFYVFRLNNHLHGYFAKFLGFPKNSELQQKSLEKQ